jgi:spermidine/putrescine transport system ATP-binding protein
VGTALDIYEAPNCRFVADFIGETNFISGTVLSTADGKAEFEADGLRMVAEAGSDVRPGLPATLAVRPERVRWSAEQPGDTPNSFAGRVNESIYIGTDTHYRVNLTPNVSVRIRRQNTVPIGLPALAGPSEIGVWVSWYPESARILTE